MDDAAWRRIFRGIYLTTHGPPSFEQLLEAVMLECGDEVVFSHQTAGWLMRLDGVKPELIHATLPRSLLQEPRPGVVFHLPRRLAEADVWRARGFRCTSPERTLVDLTHQATGRREILLMYESVYRWGRWHVRRLRRRLPELREGRRNIHVLDELLARRGAEGPPTDSPGEALADDYLWRARWFAERQWPVLDDRRRTLGRIDLAFPRMKLALEFDGFSSHGGARSFYRDRLRDQALAVRGWQTVRFFWRQLDDEAEFLGWIVPILRARARLMGVDGFGPAPTQQLAFGF